MQKRSYRRRNYKKLIDDNAYIKDLLNDEEYQTFSQESDDDYDFDNWYS